MSALKGRLAVPASHLLACMAHQVRMWGAQIGCMPHLWPLQSFLRTCFKFMRLVESVLFQRCWCYSLPNGNSSSPAPMQLTCTRSEMIQISDICFKVHFLSTADCIPTCAGSILTWSWTHFSGWTWLSTFGLGKSWLSACIPLKQNDAVAYSNGCNRSGDV